MPNAFPPRKHYLPFGRPNFGKAEELAVIRVLRSAWIGMGVETIEFEKELSVFAGAKHAVAVNSCTSALHLSLLVSGVAAGDEVIVPSLTWCSTANTVLYAGATPVFCDVDPGTLCVTPSSVLARLTERTKAVIVVHYGGYAIDVTALRRVLPKRVSIVEDAAHALGATYPNGCAVGSSGNLVCFSFYPNKNLATAEGGAVILNNARLADRLRSLRQHGLPINAWKRFTHPKSILLTHQIRELGFKMNFTDLQAGIARVQLKRQKEFTRRRLRIAQRYVSRLQSLQPQVAFQTDIDQAKHARHLMVILLPESNGRFSRDALLRSLRSRNIGAAIHYQPLHGMPLYRHKSQIKLPVTDHVYKHILTLPISASMTLEDVDCVCDHLIQLMALR